MGTVFIMYGLSALAILLGFIALLAQKTYIDSKTNQPTQLSIPIIGKIKTNYPALLFVFLGFVMAYMALEKSYPPRKIPWTIHGSFDTTASEDFDWREGIFTLHPTDFYIGMSPGGEFIITGNIEEGKTFEDVVEFIDYSHKSGSIKIYPKQELESYKQGNETLIEAITDTHRKYKRKHSSEISRERN